jgi:hypothetical protein
MCCHRVGGGGETGERGKGEIESEMGVVRGAAPSGGGGGRVAFKIMESF